MATVPEINKETEVKMQKAIEAVRNDFASVRTGRASTALLDRLQVEAYGAHVPLKQVAGVSAPDARTLQISAFDRSTVPAIRKAIETSDLGLNPNVDGATIRLAIPQLNEERRKDLVKLVKKKSEEHKVAIRNIRHHANDQVKALAKNGTITDDQIKRGTDQVQKLTDKYVKQIDDLVHGKEKEILEV